MPWKMAGWKNKFAHRLQTCDEFFHAVGAFPLHGGGHMSVAIQRECRGVMSSVLLDRFYVIPRHDGSHHIGMP